MTKKSNSPVTRRTALMRLGGLATATYMAPALTGFSAAHASGASAGSSASSASSVSSVSSVSSASSASSAASLPSDAGITDEQRAAFKDCVKGGGTATDCAGAAGIDPSLLDT